MSVARKVIGIACLGLSALLGLSAGFLTTIEGPAGQRPHPDAAGTILFAGASAVALLFAGRRLLRKQRDSRDPSMEHEPTDL